MEETSAKKFVKTKKVAMIVALLVFAGIVLGMGGAIIAGLYFRNEEVGSVNVKITTYLNSTQQGWVEYGLSLEKGLKDFAQHDDYTLGASDVLSFEYEIENSGSSDVCCKILLQGEEAQQHLNLTFAVGQDKQQAKAAEEQAFYGTDQKYVTHDLASGEKCVLIVYIRLSSGAGMPGSGDVIGNLAFSIAAVGG